MYHAHTAALRSSCLSRQVGAALEVDRKIIATGTNEVPKFGGGVYDNSDGKNDNRCFKWKWRDDQSTFTGCHNTRQKKLLRTKITEWLADKLAPELALAVHPIQSIKSDIATKARTEAERQIREYLLQSNLLMEDMPGIKDLIEFSRSIHAEMNALFNSARAGTSPEGGILYCTTFPCHYCARHLITAGIFEVYYIEPYVKSLATELHSDAIATEISMPKESPAEVSDKSRMLIVPFTGVGPRMYEDHFLKHGNLKDDETGDYVAPSGEIPTFAVRLNEMAMVEQAAADLVPDS